MSRPHGRARVDPTSPAAFAVCDRCGFWYSHRSLRWQVDYRGMKLQNLRILVCDRCYDDPQPQLKPRIIGPDPLPIMNARPETAVTVTTSVSTTYSVLSTDQLISCTGPSSFTVNLPSAVVTSDTFTWPTAVGTAGRTITVQANGTGSITVAVPDGQFINNGYNTVTLNPGAELAFLANGANWETIPAGLTSDDPPLLTDEGLFVMLSDGTSIIFS